MIDWFLCNMHIGFDGLEDGQTEWTAEKCGSGGLQGMRILAC